MSIRFEPVLESDFPTIADWLAQDQFEVGRKTPEFFLTGNPKPQMFSAKVVDDEGSPILFFRMDNSGHFHTEFAPETIVSKKKLVETLLQGFPAIVGYAKQMGWNSLIFETRAPLLASFMARTFGFVKMAGANDDYILQFGDTN